MEGRITSTHPSPPPGYFSSIRHAKYCEIGLEFVALPVRPKMHWKWPKNRQSPHLARRQQTLPEKQSLYSLTFRTPPPIPRRCKNFVKPPEKNLGPDRATRKIPIHCPRPSPHNVLPLHLPYAQKGANSKMRKMRKILRKMRKFLKKKNQKFSCHGKNLRATAHFQRRRG